MGSPALILLAAALAGVTTLAAELLWIRGLGRGVGTTYEAAAIVVGLVLAGLGLGAWRGARRAAVRPARGAALCLLIAGVWVALSPWALGRLGDAHVALLDALGLEGGGGLLPALLLAVPLVLPASIALGWAFPLLVRLREAGLEQAGARAGGVYAVQTLGAGLGVALSLLVLDAAGESTALRAAGGCALAGALLLLLCDRPDVVDGAPAAAAPGEPARATAGLGLVLALSGGIALVAQLAWLRLLQPLAGAHVLGAALLLAPVLLALALGAAIGGRWADRARHPERLVPLFLWGAGLFTLLSLPLAARGTLWIAQAEAGARIGAVLGAFAVATAPATLCFGALLPAAIRARAPRDGTTTGPAGRLFAANALGALVGSAMAGGLLLPTWGAERTLLVAALVAVAAAVAFRWRVGGPRRVLATALAALPLVALAVPGLLGAWIRSGPSVPELIVAGKPPPPGLALEDGTDLALYASIWGGRRAERSTREGVVRMPLFEGRGGRIALIEEPSGVVGLRRGTLRESVFDPDRPDTPAPTEYALGLLPALLAPHPGRALVIGHGAGWTAEAVLAGCDARVEVAEIDRTVLDAARTWRGLERLASESSARARLIEADGRVLLRRAARQPAAQRYSLIASQPSHPWHPASGHLFTKEAFAAAHDALTPDGILAQWLNLFDLTPTLLERALASFRSVFEHVWIFRFPDELVMVGFRAPPALDIDRWTSFFAIDNDRSAGARRAGFLSAPDLWKHISLDTAAVDRVVPMGTPLLRDDHPELELTLAWRRLTRAPPLDAQAVLLRGFPPTFEAMLPRPEFRERWLAGAVEGWLRADAPGEARLWATAPRWGVSVEARLTRARAAAAGGDAKTAAALLGGARAEWPARGDVAAAWIRAMKDLVPSMDRRARFQLSQTVDALVDDTFAGDGRVLLAAAQYRRALGELEPTRALFERALAARDVPAPPGTRIQLARLLLTGAYEEDTELRAIGLLSAEEDTYRDIDLLDLLLRLTSAVGDEERARTLEKALATLQRARGLGLVRAARNHLARHEFADAIRVSGEARTAWSMQPAVHELSGLVMLAAMAAARAGGAPVDLTIQDAIVAFRAALSLERDPVRRRARIQRMLRWFGVDAGLLADRRKPDAE